MKIKLLSAAIASSGFMFAAPSQAHITNTDMGTLGATPLIGSATIIGSSWATGKRDTLGDSHAAIRFFKFNLSQATTLQISLNESVRSLPDRPLNPAFSVYLGALPNQAHDDALLDEQNPMDNDFLPAMSATDHAPGDPNIRRYIPQGYDESGAALVDANYNVLVTENPIWNTPNPNGIDLGGLTPAQWYAANYTPHNGYRDTLNYTATGGLVLDPTTNTLQYGDAGYLNGYLGQFDAFGSWSMANESGEWSKIEYISSANSTPCAGPNCETTSTGGYVNPGHFLSAIDATVESMILRLAAGTYTVIAGSELGGGGGSAQLTLTAVPLPASFWLMGSMLWGFGGMKLKNRNFREARAG